MGRSEQLSSANAERRTTTFHQTLILLFSALYFSSGGGGQPMEKRVADAMNDPAHPEREEQAVDLARQVDEHTGKKLQRFMDWRKRLYEDLSQPEWNEARVASRFDEVIGELRTHEDEYLELWMGLRETLNGREWQKLFPED